MATQNKTVKNNQSVTEFVNGITDPKRKKDCKAVAKIMREATGKRAKMWGTTIVGYGEYHYKYDSGREGDHMITGFSPRKQNLTVYIMPGFSNYQPLMKKLGKHKTGKSCLYINSLEDVDSSVLAQLIKRSVTDMRKKYPTK
ncbi:MAG: DUF1801 domain-containing protein [Pseudomonadota bacterium]